jgi:xylose dehydrogenase (NAD/NADP)
MAPVRWGVLGTAKIAIPLIEGVREAGGDAQVTAVASRDGAKARAYAEQHGVPRAIEGYEAMLADPDIDAVYICLPNGMHHDWTMRALEAGKHVLCEKPYTRRADEAVEAFGRAEAFGLLLSEAFMWRHNPQTQLLREALTEIGRLESMHATFGFRLEDQTNHRLDAVDGGSLMDVGCYCINGSRMIAGEEPSRVFARHEPGPGHADLRMTGVLEFPSGFTATFASTFTASTQGIEVVGEHGIVRVPDPWHCRQGVVIVDGDERRVTPANSYALEVADVTRAIQTDGEVLVGRDETIGQARAIEAVYRSADTGEPVSLAG